MKNILAFLVLSSTLPLTQNNSQKESGLELLSLEIKTDMIINQILFADNERWQRSGWNSVILTQVGARKVGKGKCIEL